MQIIAHRGYWNEDQEKNTIRSLSKAIEIGYGIETDIRDFDGKLVISHNIADEKAPLAEELLEYYYRHNSKVTLAFNVKADGLQYLIKSLLEKYNIKNYFLFDMSVPELVVNKKIGLQYYTRNSDIEKECVMIENSNGVWIDCFYDDEWLTEEIIWNHINLHREVCIVSPELHGKEYLQLWWKLKKIGLSKYESIAICTDLPDEARRFFNE